MKKRVLIVDNEPHIREVTQLALELVAGWQVLTAGSGQEAIATATLEHPDAILMDVMMPDMDGLTTFGKLQADPITKPIPVILLTAQIQPVDRHHYQSLGIRHAIAKPFDPIKLAQEIATTLGWEAVV
jgi:CheY-like chemotaxis protein